MDYFVIYILGHHQKYAFPASEFLLRLSVLLKFFISLISGHIIYCDRCFITLKLIFKELYRKWLNSVGTVLKNRISRYFNNDLDGNKIYYAEVGEAMVCWCEWTKELPQHNGLKTNMSCPCRHIDSANCCTHDEYGNSEVLDEFERI